MANNVDFICLTYKNSDYLIEKSNISNSFYIGLKKFDKYSREISVENEKVTAINFDYIIEKLFHDEGKTDESMVLKIGDRYFESSGEPFVKSIAINDFNLFGTVVDRFCQKKGILAVNYLENGKIQYLIDVEKIEKSFNEEI